MNYQTRLVKLLTPGKQVKQYSDREELQVSGIYISSLVNLINREENLLQREEKQKASIKD